MNKAIKILIFIASLAIITGSCKVKVNNQESAPVNIKTHSILWLLAGDSYKAWTVELFTVNGLDQLKEMKPCQQDNLDLYYRNLVYESVEGNTKCEKTDPDLRQRGKWSMNSDSTTVELKLGRQLFTIQIVELTETRFHYKVDLNGQITEAVLKSADYQPVDRISAE